MLQLTDEQLAIIQRAANPLHPHDRGAFLERVAEMLRGHELGDGIISRVAAEAQHQFLRGGFEIRVAGGKYARGRNV